MTAPQAALFGLLCLSAGCAKLPAVTANECGNGVFESDKEDCDTFAPYPGAVCRPRGSVGQCRLDCQRRADGTRPPCPAGWGCDAQDLCRMPTGAFALAEPARVAGAWTLMAGDFDGDGRADVLGREPLDAFRNSRVRMHYFDGQGVLSETRAFAKAVGSPVIADLSGDGRSDLLFREFSVGLLLGQADRSWLPETFSSYNFPDTSVRTVGVHDSPITDYSAVAGVISVPGGLAVAVIDPRRLLRQLGELPGTIEGLVGDPIAGNVIEDPVGSPCREVVIAIRGGQSFNLIDLCVRASMTAEVTWREHAQLHAVALDPPSAIDGAPQMGDLNGDGHLDVLLGAGGKTYVAYGDGRGLARAVPLPLLFHGTDTPRDIPVPLAVGDFTGDDLVDFVLKDRLVVSVPSGGPVPLYTVTRNLNVGAPWTVARIADLNGNGRLDVVAASAGGLGLDFFNGNDTPYLVQVSQATNRPIRHLEVGDFDGDSVTDVAFIEAAASGAERDVLSVAYGQVAGSPRPPAAVARIKDAEQLNVFAELGTSQMLVASTVITAGRKSGVLAILDGTGDRTPFAPYNLAAIAADGQLRAGGALAVTAGAFTAPGQQDVMVLLSEGPPAGRNWTFWLLPAFASLQSVGVPLRGTLGPGLTPAEGAVMPDVKVFAEGVALDADQDGRSEAVWMMPAETGRRCGLVTTAVDSKGSELINRGTTWIEEPCRAPQVSSLDADSDGAADLVLLTGSPGEPDRKLLVLWNDGKGGFAAGRATRVDGGDSPQQYALLGAVPGRASGFVYVTDRSVMLATASGSRQFGPPRPVTGLPGGSGIAVADVTGDGVQDLVLSASGFLSVWKAQLKVP